MDITKYRRLMAEIVLTKNYNCTVAAKYAGEEECNICLCPMQDTQTISICCSDKHTYHKECYLQGLVEYRHTKCPDCNEDLKKPLAEIDRIFEMPSAPQLAPSPPPDARPPLLCLDEIDLRWSNPQLDLLYVQLRQDNMLATSIERHVRH